MKIYKTKREDEIFLNDEEAAQAYQKACKKLKGN